MQSTEHSETEAQETGAWKNADDTSLRDALMIACRCIADSRQTYEEANTAEGWFQEFVRRAGGKPDLRREIVAEIYRAFVLLGAGNDLLGLIGSWGDSLPAENVLSGLRAWNRATVPEIKGRIEHYETSFRQ